MSVTDSALLNAYAEMSEAAYGEMDESISILGPSGTYVEIVAPVIDGPVGFQARAFFNSTTSELVIAFSGTEGFANVDLPEFVPGLQCRVQTGLAVAATSAPADALKATGEMRWFAASSDAERGFCPTCGTLLFWRAHAEDTVSIMAGSLDDQTALTADRHIFVADKPGWHAIGDGLPRYAASSAGTEPLDP